MDDAVLTAKISVSDSLQTKIDKSLKLLNEERYFYPKGRMPKLDPPFNEPYHLDSMRTPEEILSRKVGGSCGSSARALAAMLNASGVNEEDLQIVESVVNQDLKIICPEAGKPRVERPQTGARGHSFVAIRVSGDSWQIINPIDGSRTYGRADWYSPKELHGKMALGPVEVPGAAFKRLPKETYGEGLTAFQSWSLSVSPRHSFEQRFDLIASGRLGASGDQSVKLCRFTSR